MKSLKRLAEAIQAEPLALVCELHHVGLQVEHRRTVDRVKGPHRHRQPAGPGSFREPGAAPDDLGETVEAEVGHAVEGTPKGD